MMRSKRRRWLALFAMMTVAALVVAAGTKPVWPQLGLIWQRQVVRRIARNQAVPRPYGMAPVAFSGFLRACNNAKVQPWRISQAIGDHPRSAGYHRRDGVIWYQRQKYDYTTAVDIATDDLDRPQIFRLVDKLGEQGFAAFYREGPKWTNGEHIHAVYAGLKMKPQLQRQVREWVGKRKKAGKKAYSWERKFRHYWE